MKIVMIHGQQTKGISYHIGQEVVKKIPQANITEFFLPRDVPYFCTGCKRCMEEGLQYCLHHDALSPMLSALKESDVFLFTTPVYCMHTTGSMKAFLDHCFVYWMVHRPRSYMYKKKAIIISVGAGAGMKKASKDIKDSLEGWGVSDIQCLTQRGMAISWDTVSDKTRRSIDKKAIKIASRMQKKTKHASIKCKATFYAMRFMHKKGMSASKLDIAYWEEQGWLAHKRPWNKT